MFKIESYVTPILLSYVDKYVKDFRPADAQVSLWEGGVVLHNLVLKTDVLQQEVALPFTLVSGRIHELLIQVPWTKIMSEPIIVTIDTIECILNVHPKTEEVKPEPKSNHTQVLEAPPGYMQALVRRIVSNISIRIHHLILKYVQDDIVLSLNVKHLSIDSADAEWKAAFADIDQNNPVIRRLVTLDDLTLCLDSSDSDGKIRFYQDPLLYRCSLNFRVLVKLVSANTRRASSIDIQLRTEKLAWGVTNDQLLLLLRLLKETAPMKDSANPITPEKEKSHLHMPMSATNNTKTSKSNLQSKISMSKQQPPAPSNAAEPVRRESWSEWAWSWMPSTVDRESSREEAHIAANPTPIAFSAYLDEVSLIIKVLEMETINRKRSYSLLEFCAYYAAAKGSICAPTLLMCKFGIRNVVLKSTGKCPCGHLDIHSISNEPTLYLCNRDYRDEPEVWSWPKDEQPKAQVEEIEAGKEGHSKLDDIPEEEGESSNLERQSNISEEIKIELKSSESRSQLVLGEKVYSQRSVTLKPISEFELFAEETLNEKKEKQADGYFWDQLSPIINFEIIHERSPPSLYANPYDNPPKDFEYSDWEEECDIHVQIKPMNLRICMGLIHRLILIKDLLGDKGPPPNLEPMRTLTVEECDALNQNLPQRRINIEIIDFCINVHPWDHLATKRPAVTPLLLQVELPKANLVITAPLYAKRVCSAAGQMPKDDGVLWQGCRAHCTGALSNMKVSVYSPSENKSKPCGRIDLQFVTHTLLFPEYFAKKRSVLFSFAVKIREANISGSAARLNAAWQIILSLMKQKVSMALRHSSLAKDAVNDEGLVALDITAEELLLRNFNTKMVHTYLLTLQTLRATVFHSTPGTEELEQAWLFSGPDTPTSTPYVRFTLQYCTETFPEQMDYFGIWTETTAVAIDPLLISWLSYTPTILLSSDSSLQVQNKPSTFVFRRRTTPTSSSGRGATRSGSESFAEQVHIIKPRSVDSNSEMSERKQKNPSVHQPVADEQISSGNIIIKLYNQLKKVWITVELSMILVYVTTKSATALDCDTVRVAMEQHATNSEAVMVFSAGRWQIYSKSVHQQMWHFIQQDGPTYETKPDMPEADTEEEKVDEETGFPWKMAVSDVSCYTLALPAPSTDLAEVASGIRSQLKASEVARPVTILEHVSTNVTLSVVKKSLQHKIVIQKSESASKPTINREEAKLKYFTSGSNFKATTLLEFLRGPIRRKKEFGTQSAPQCNTSSHSDQPTVLYKKAGGPIVSLGVNMHADTAPIVVRLNHKQVQLLSVTIHCLSHVINLLQRDQMRMPKRSVYISDQKVSRTGLRSEMDPEVTSLTGSTGSVQSDQCMTIFTSVEESPVKSFFWFQWIVSKGTIVLAAEKVKIAVEIEDISASIDLQQRYNQFKIKINTVSIKNFERTSEGWTAGAIGGRVLQVREPSNSLEDTHFLSITITSAKIGSLPESWKEELHPKLLEQKSAVDTMLEIYTVLAPLEIILVPKTLESILLVANAIKSCNLCTLPQVEEPLNTTSDLPYCYLNAGGVKILVACDVEKKEVDDTFMLTIGKISINPHPENPICRRTIANSESSWNSMAGSLEGRQYELSLKNITLQTSQFYQIVTQLENTSECNITRENPAHMWSQPTIIPSYVTILHPLSIDLLYAPPLIVDGSLICGSGLEINFTSDCAIEVSIDQLFLAMAASRAYQHSLQRRVSNDILLCPYATFLQASEGLGPQFSTIFSSDRSRTTLIEDDNIPASDYTGAVDSGMDTATSRSTLQSSHQKDTPVKKSVSHVQDSLGNTSDYLEVFITTGLFEISLYTFEDGSELIKEVRPNKIRPDVELLKTERISKNEVLAEFSDKTKNATAFNLHDRAGEKLTSPNSVPLLHVTFHQPNLYYWKRKSSKSLQVSLFNMWFGLGSGLMDNYWQSPIMSTTRGEPDPVTDIPPALVTMKFTSGSLGAGPISSRATLNFDVERPILIDVSDDNIRRLIGIYKLMQEKLERFISSDTVELIEQSPVNPLPYKLRKLFTEYGIEVAYVQTSQIGLRCAGAIVGCDSTSMQISMSTRRDQLTLRALLGAVMLSTDQSDYNREPIIHPHHIGIQMNACWEAWQRAEGQQSAKTPSVRIIVDMDALTIDFTPDNLIIVKKIQETLKTILSLETKVRKRSDSIDSGDDLEPYENNEKPLKKESSHIIGATTEGGDHFYMDDLRSGAFKIVSGGQLPMAYQVTLYKHVVSWRYPHPRAITRVVAFPLPDQEEEVDCVLEFFCKIQNQWETHLHIKLPIAEPREVVLHHVTPEVIYSNTWRFRVAPEDNPVTYQFNMKMFQPTSEPIWAEDYDPGYVGDASDITAEQLSGILRVDSYFTPCLTPRNELCVRFAKLDAHVHNLVPETKIESSDLEGYYVSKALIRAHRVVSVLGQQGMLNFRSGTAAGSVLLLRTQMSSQIVECSTGTMEPLVDTFKVQVGLSLPENSMAKSRLRLCMTSIRIALHVSRLRSLQMLAQDWQKSIDKHLNSKLNTTVENMKPKEETVNNAADVLEGKVTLWIHNSSTVPLQLGQEGTDEVFPLGPDAKLAYRWRDPVASKRLRFSYANSLSELCWSNSIPFSVGECRVRLENSEGANNSSSLCAANFLYVSVKQIGSYRYMSLAGRLVLANMLKLNLIYKVRSLVTGGNNWKTLASGELAEESIGRSVISPFNAEMVLKIRFLNHDTGWSGDIPLKECPKENVPWLVKVPSKGDVPYISVWCRVVRARSDGRIFASIWPLFILRSHLTLDTDVLLASDICPQHTQQVPGGRSEARPPPLIQTAAGRGATTHLLAPGTTAARHTLSFQYRNIDCPVTRDAVPLHYGVTDTSVFDKRLSVNTIDEVSTEISDWLLRSRTQRAASSWPFSIVTKHWSAQWKPALLQPRCDVAVRYQAVRAGGGGCSLEVRLSPVVLVCNAAPIAVTLRAHDAAPLCKLEGGNVISPPSIILNKPFFLSVEMDRETFVSKQLEVCSKDPGRYGAPPPGQVAVDHPATFTIPCRQKVAVLNLHYEIKEEINVMGLTTAFVFVNNFSCPVLISAIALPDEKENNVPPVLQTESYQLIQPSKPENSEFVSLCRFNLTSRWRGEDVSELFLYLCIALPTESDFVPIHKPVPVRLAIPPMRKPIALHDALGNSMAAVVTQHKHEERWIVTLACDPCPQFLVDNQTSLVIAVAQPLPPVDETDTTVHVLPECEGVVWWCKLDPGGSAHYSGPGYTFTQSLPYERSATIPKLTFSEVIAHRDPMWCAPVEMTTGEQLVQLSFKVTIKVHVRTYPHTTLVDLQDVDSNDISASDIRNRLRKLSKNYPKTKNVSTDTAEVTRTPGDEKLLKPIILEVMRKMDMKLLESELQTIVENDEVQARSNTNNIMSDKSVSIATTEQQTKFMIKDASEHDDTTEENHLEIKKPEVTSDGELMINENDLHVKHSETVMTTAKLYGPSGKKENDLVEPDQSFSQTTETKTNSKITDRKSVIKHDGTLETDSKFIDEKNLNTHNDAATTNSKIVDDNSVNKHDDTIETNSNIIDEKSAIKHDDTATTNYKIIKKISAIKHNDTAETNSKSMSVMTEIVVTTVSKQTTTGIGSAINSISSRIMANESSILLRRDSQEWDGSVNTESSRARCMVAGVVVVLAAAEDTPPLLALHVDRIFLLLTTLHKQIKTSLSIADIQLDNLQYESGQYDFAVIATTRAEPVEPDHWPTVWDMFTEQSIFSERPEISRIMVHTTHDFWTVMNYNHSELSEIEFHAGPLALYVEDAFISALVEMFRLALPPTKRSKISVIMAEARSLQNPLRLRLLYIHPVDLTLTLHTAVRIYIALDQSPLHLNAFKINHVFTSVECLTHALTVHYLSAAILGAGWVVGGLELLGAPGALAARVGGATGGVRGVASTTAAALLRSLSACAGSLARNLDLLAGDEEHARRAAAARRRPPDSFVGGLVAGFTNFAINILGAVGGLAHHPLVGVAVGETESSATALRRSLVGAVTKPLSATADLLAYAGHGLLKQTGWDPVPQPRPSTTQREYIHMGWRRDCVRWVFRLADRHLIAGFDVLVDDAPLQILITHRSILMAEPETARIVENIELQYCTVGPYVGGTVELNVTPKRPVRVSDTKPLNEDDEFHISEAAMARVARYTGAESAGAAAGGESRTVTLVPVPGQSQALHATLVAIVHANKDSHFSLI